MAKGTGDGKPAGPEAVYYLGPEGTFTHAAALSQFGSGPKLVPCRDIGAVFEAVRGDRDGRGVVPIENSIEGSVNLTLEELSQDDGIQIVGEQVVRVEQCLMAHCKLSEIESVRSHPHALAQCKYWLRRHLPRAKLITTGSTAQAAHALRQHPKSGAIASELAANLAQVPILDRGIQDRSINATRFAILGRHAPARTGDDKTSLVFSAPHERGALYRVLEVFDQEGLNLCRIESRPNPEQIWEYVFYADVEGHVADANVARALERLKRSGQLLRSFGSYPRARVPAPL